MGPSDLFFLAFLLGGSPSESYMDQMSWDSRFQGALSGDRCPGILETDFQSIV